MDNLHSKLSIYKVDHLFILVGGNPLPCYVAAKLLVKDKGRIYLVYSTKTKEYANSLAKVLGCCTLVPLNDAERKADKIFDCIYAQSSNLKGTVGLHYTGGTKVMSVHSYRAIVKQYPDAICSYLDPDRLELCFEKHNQIYGSPMKLTASGTNEATGLRLHQLWQLHNKRPLKAGHSEYTERVESIIPGMASLLAKHFGDTRWAEWVGAFKGNARLEADETIEKLPYQDVVDRVKEWNPTIKTIGQLYEALSSRSKNYLGEGGDWLEDWVLENVQELKKEFGFNDVVCSARTQRANKPSECEMELDIVAIRGYQLFIFSCYAGSTMDTCKTKLYEAAMRARQLGGSEARFALVCGHSNKTKVEDQMSGTTSELSYKVFDRYDLPDLKTHLAQWIRQVDKETSR
jgi:hypothetical protein